MYSMYLTLIYYLVSLFHLYLYCFIFTKLMCINLAYVLNLSQQNHYPSIYCLFSAATSYNIFLPRLPFFVYYFKNDNQLFSPHSYHESYTFSYNIVADLSHCNRWITDILLYIVVCHRPGVSNFPTQGRWLWTY